MLNASCTRIIYCSVTPSLIRRGVLASIINGR
jgi:hypothetical protein